MEETIYIPGITDHTPETDAARTEREELAKLRVKIASEYVDGEANNASRKAKILEQVTNDCKHFNGPIEITQEMIDLEIDDEVKKIITYYDFMHPLLSLLQSDPDEEDYSEDQLFPS